MQHVITAERSRSAFFRCDFGLVLTFRRLLEITNRFAHRSADLRQTTGPKHNHDYNKYNYQLRHSETKQEGPPFITASVNLLFSSTTTGIQQEVLIRLVTNAVCNVFTVTLLCPDKGNDEQISLHLRQSTIPHQGAGPHPYKICLHQNQ